MNKLGITSQIRGNTGFRPILHMQLFVVKQLLTQDVNEGRFWWKNRVQSSREAGKILVKLGLVRIFRKWVLTIGSFYPSI